MPASVVKYSICVDVLAKRFRRLTRPISSKAGAGRPPLTIRPGAITQADHAVNRRREAFIGTRHVKVAIQQIVGDRPFTPLSLATTGARVSPLARQGRARPVKYLTRHRAITKRGRKTHAIVKGHGRQGPGCPSNRRRWYHRRSR